MVAGGGMKLRARTGVLFAVIALLGLCALAFANLYRSHSYDHVVSIAQAPAYQDAALLERAWALPVAAAYREDGFEYQSNPSFCGPASAANVAQSFGVAMTQTSALEGASVRPVFGLLPGGVTLDQEAEILRLSTDRAVTVLRDLDLAGFRAELARANDPALRYVINFHRGPLFGDGHGHFSPILGYLAQEDLVFVGDVNEEFQPFLVSSARLFEAMNTTDTATGLKRGLLRVEAAE
jgi:hypothetical protein